MDVTHPDQSAHAHSGEGGDHRRGQHANLVAWDDERGPHNAAGSGTVIEVQVLAVRETPPTGPLVARVRSPT